MSDVEALLEGLGSLLGNSFKNPIVWEQRDKNLIGKYVYIKYEGKELGVFMGYLVNGSNTIRACITFFFTHPASGVEEAGNTRRLFHKLLIRFNLRLKAVPYKLVTGKSPAIIRTMYFDQNGFSTIKSEHFFGESIKAIKSCEPLYRAVSL
ncbi:MAG: hypothetical protein MN733_42865 [Nitrososphaera sp.]|nr:hypothetical protein [Nitrososphaera sp.]